MESFEHVYEVRSKKGRLAVLAAILAIFLFIFLIGSGNDGKLAEATVLERAPALVLTEAELALADTILDHEGFRSALSYDLVENTTTFTWEDTEDVIGSVIPADGTVTEVCVSGAVVIIDYRQHQHRIILEYVDADRSGKVDSIRKTLTPLIDGGATGCYTANYNLATGKFVYTYKSY